MKSTWIISQGEMSGHRALAAVSSRSAVNRARPGPPSLRFSTKGQICPGEGAFPLGRCDAGQHRNETEGCRGGWT